MASNPRNFPSLTWQRRKTAKTLSLRPKARKITSPAPRQFCQRAGGQVLRATARDVRLQARACISGWYKQDVSAFQACLWKLAVRPEEGAASLNLSLPGPGPQPHDLSAAGRLRSAGNPPPAPTRPHPARALTSRVALAERPGVRDTQEPRAAAASPASAGLCAPRPVVRGRRRILHLPSVTLTTSVCAQTVGLRSPRGSRSGGLLAKRPAPAGPRRASAGGGGGRAGWATKSGAQASVVCGCWVLSGRRGLRSATHPPPTPRPAPPLVTSRAAAPERGGGGRGLGSGAQNPALPAPPPPVALLVF